MGIPVPSGLAEEEIEACDRFSRAIWGKPLFDREPSHSGRHGWSCEMCWDELKKREAERARREQAKHQPWHGSNVVALDVFRIEREAA